MLNNKWNPIEEVCGYIAEDGSLQQLVNLAEDPKVGFCLDLALIPSDAQGLWHTHPSNDENLSVEDYINFLQFPDYIHRIYTKDSYAEYYVRNNLVLKRE